MPNSKEIILITGCSGRVGMSVIERFGGKYPIVGFDIAPPSKQFENMEFVKVDLSSDLSVKNGLDYIKEKYGRRILSVIHLAAYYSFSDDSPVLYDKITVKGTERLLKGIKQFDTEQFIFSSTMLIYKPCVIGETIDENSTISSQWNYPASKIKTEKVIRELHGNIPYVILRIAGCYDEECHSIPISNQIQRIFEGQLESRFFPGDKRAKTSFLHLKDLSEAIWLSVEKRKELPKEVELNIGEEAALSYDELQRKISKLISGSEMSTIRIPKWFAKMGSWVQSQLPCMKESFIKPWMIDLADNNYVLDTTKAKEVLGWKPKQFVGDVLPKMIHSLKKDPSHWYKENSLLPPACLTKKCGDHE